MSTSDDWVIYESDRFVLAHDFHPLSLLAACSSYSFSSIFKKHFGNRFASFCIGTSWKFVTCVLVRGLKDPLSSSFKSSEMKIEHLNFIMYLQRSHSWTVQKIVMKEAPFVLMSEMFSNMFFIDIVSLTFSMRHYWACFRHIYLCVSNFRLLQILNLSLTGASNEHGYHWFGMNIEVFFKLSVKSVSVNVVVHIEVLAGSFN